MKIKDVVNIIDGEVMCCEHLLENDVEFAFASDLMSDVLTTQVDKMMLLTGLANLQAIRTAEMSDVGCVVFVRNKKVTPEMISLASELGIVIIECKWSMYRASGQLFENKLKPIF